MNSQNKSVFDLRDTTLGQNQNESKQAKKKQASKKNARAQSASTDTTSQKAIPRGAPNADFVKLLIEDARAGGADVLSVGDSYDDFVSVAQASDGTVYAAYYNGHDQIRMHRQDKNGDWSVHSPVPLAGSRPDIWMPQLAVDANGRVWVIWAEQTGQSAGKTGNWDLYARARDDGKWGPLIRLTDDSKPDINPHVATDTQGNIHVVWQAHPQNNGDIQYCRYDGTAWSDPLAFTSDEESDWYPRVAIDHSGTAWIAFDTQDGWAKPVELPASYGRISVFSRILPDRRGGLLVGYSGDARNVVNFHQPIHDTAMFRHIAAPKSEPGSPERAAYQPPEPPAGIPEWNTALERRELAAIRDHRVTIDGVEHQIARGDLHRHTEFSWDVGPGNDGSFLDFYRYMIDVAGMDFGGLTDHQGGGHYAYWWWLTEKSCDMYYLAPRYVPLYGYERSARCPNGHRNVFHAYRGVPVFPFQLTLDQKGVFPGVASGTLVDNDTKLLYEYLHRSGGISIPHTSGTPSMGTDWRDSDPEIEPVVEIYQGARNSYEALDAPRVHPKDQPAGRAPGGFQKAGLLWNAYKKGYRLGTIASSDHGSTHISDALVYTPKNDRHQIIDSIRKRHTWGATENIILEIHTNDGGFMGDETTTAERPALTIRVSGTQSIAKLSLVRNNEYVYTSKPGKRELDMKWVDMKPPEGANQYYCRVEQSDGEVAWSSPVWITVK